MNLILTRMNCTQRPPYNLITSNTQLSDGREFLSQYSRVYDVKMNWAQDEYCPVTNFFFSEYHFKQFKGRTFQCHLLKRFSSANRDIKLIDFKCLFKCCKIVSKYT